MTTIQDKMRRFMTDLSKDKSQKKTRVDDRKTVDVEVSPERQQAEEQKQKALDRLQNRTIERPDKKEIKLSKPDGRYVKPKIQEQNKDPKPVSDEAPKTPFDEKLKGLSKYVKKLRGITKARVIEPTFQNENFFPPQESVLFQEPTNPVAIEKEQPYETPQTPCHIINPPEQDKPNGVVATALSVGVGVIYWDDTDQLIDRLITIRRLFRRQGDILIDAFCHDLQAPRVILFSRLVRLYDLKTLVPYSDLKDFLLYDIAGVSTRNGSVNDAFIQALSRVRYDLAALAFVARSDVRQSDVQNQLILKYVKNRCEDIALQDQEMISYIERLFPDEQSFYEAVDVMVQQPHSKVYSFVETFVQVILCDGVVADKERELLAELLYVLKIQGIELHMLGLK